MDQPPAIPKALVDPAPGADLGRKPPRPNVHASKGRATQLANMAEGDANGLSLPNVSQAADAWDSDIEPATGSPPDAGFHHESRLAALIANTAQEQVNPCRALDVAVFPDSERGSAVSRCMGVGG